MEKIYGATSAQNGLYRVGRLKWEVIYGFGKDHQEDETGYNYRLRYSYRPRLENIKKDIVEAINEIVREKILQGLQFRGLLVWLSAENQRNYTNWFTMAMINESNLPITVRLGTDEEPEEVTFNTLEEITEFYETVENHIKNTIDEGRMMKKSINWEDYENEKD